MLEARASQTAASLLPSSEAGLTSQGTPHPTLPHLHQQKPRDPWREGSLMHSAQSAPHPTFTLPGPPSACLDAFPAHVYLEPSFLGSLLSMLQGTTCPGSLGAPVPGPRFQRPLRPRDRHRPPRPVAPAAPRGSLSASGHTRAVLTPPNRSRGARPLRVCGENSESKASLRAIDSAWKKYQALCAQSCSR